MCCARRSAAEWARQSLALPKASYRQFALQRGAHFGTFQDVRTTIALLALLAAASPTIAQEQEGKLIDRVLKPNMSLANPAQNKQFIATGTVTDKRAPSKNFYAPAKPNVRIFAIDRVITPTEFASRHFRTGESTAIVVSRAPVTKADAVYSTNSTPDIRVASGSDNTVRGSTYSGNRPFLDRGKSQKALAVHNPPFTIEQVRELLNKNK